MPLVLQRFSHITKEMRPSHRVDVLTHALFFYGLNTKQRLGIIMSVLNITQFEFVHDHCFA